jgi:RNA polymerase-binding transcription factor
MAEDVIDMAAVRAGDSTRSRLRAELDDIAIRLHVEAGVPKADVLGGDFLDVAQGIEHQELARLTASRLAERARRLREALTRYSDGEYGVCSECGGSIPAKRLRALPDATTCVACQAVLERAHTGGSTLEDSPAL